MNVQFVKTNSVRLWAYLTAAVGLPGLIIIALLLAYFAFASIRDWQTQRELERQGERIDKYSEQSDKSVTIANQYLQLADATHEATLELANSVKHLSDDVKTLAERDRAVTVRVDNTKKDYQNARNQNQKNSSSAVRSNRSLREREDDVLSADRSLFPD